MRKKAKEAPSTENANIRTKASKIITLLEKEYPEAKTALEYGDPLELLISTILSAQCTDERVNIVTKTLFKKYRKTEDYAAADLRELEKDIRSTGFYRNKARNIKKCCQKLVEESGSQVPRTMKELLTLPGVGRKTANIVLSNAYGVVEGIAVDTHVRRVAKRLGLTSKEDPGKIEADLMNTIPKGQWIEISDLLISLGRRVCGARKPKCDICILNKLCPSAFRFAGKPESGT